MAPTPEDINLPTPSLDEVFDLVGDAPFEHAMLIASVLAAEVYHHPFDRDRHLRYAADMFPPPLFARIQRFVTEGPARTVFDLRFLLALQRVLIRHAAPDTQPARDLTRAEVNQLAGALLGLAGALPRADPPEPEPGADPDWYAWTSFFVQTAAWYDAPYILEAVARSYAAFAEIAGSAELAEHPARTEVDERLSSVYGLNLREQLGVGLAVAAVTKAVDPDVGYDERRIHLNRGFLGGGSLASREAEVTALISASREELMSASSAAGESPHQIAWDHSLLERFPVLRLPGDRLRLMSPRALVAWMTRGLHYRLLDAAGDGLAGREARDARGLFLTFTGALGEHYVRNLVRSSLRRAEAAGAVRVHGEVEFHVGRRRCDSPDVAVDAGPDLMLVEVYSGRMSLEARTDANSPAVKDFVRRAIADKLVELAARTEDLLAGNLRYDGVDVPGLRRVWPVLVLTGDAVAPTALLWGHLRSSCPQAFLDDARVQRLIICDLDDLEPLLALAEEGRHLPELLAEFLNSGAEELPVRNWVSQAYGLERRPSFVADHFSGGLEQVGRTIFGNASS